MTQPTKHTPAPWIAHPSPESDGKYHVFNGDGDYLTLDDDVHEANARLIAAAPELLEALQEAYKEIRAWRDGLNHVDMNKAKVGAKYIYESKILDAIAKATKGA